MEKEKKGLAFLLIFISSPSSLASSIVYRQFYIITFYNLEKNAHLAREFSSLAAFSIHIYVWIYENGAKELNSHTTWAFLFAKGDDIKLTI